MTIKAVVTKPVVDREYGEVTVSFTPPVAVQAVMLTAFETAEVANRTLAFIPTPEGYFLTQALEPAVSLERVFAIKPVKAEVGKTYACEAVAQWGNGPDQKESVPFKVLVEARPEVYAALGALEHARRVLFGAYEAFKQVGKEVHQGTALPAMPVEPASQTLQPESFQWALRMVEKGTRLFKESLAEGANQNPGDIHARSVRRPGGPVRPGGPMRPTPRPGRVDPDR